MSIVVVSEIFFYFLLAHHNFMILPCSAKRFSDCMEIATLLLLRCSLHRKRGQAENQAVGMSAPVEATFFVDLRNQAHRPGVFLFVPIDGGSHIQSRFVVESEM